MLDKLRSLRAIVLTLIAGLLVVAFTVGASDESSIQRSVVDAGVESSPLVTRLVPLEGQRVRVDIINRGDWPLEVETRDTPFDSFHAHSMLLVERSLKSWSPLSRLVYTGRVAKRVAPGPDERIVLAAGAMASAVVDIGANYLVESAEPHRVSLAHYWKVRVLEKPVTTIRSGNVIDGFIDLAASNIAPQASTLMSLSPSNDYVLRARAPIFDGCSVTQRSEIAAAHEVAEDMVLDAVTGLASLTGTQRSTSPRYNTWFGAYDESRYNRVRANFDAIADALADETVNYVCGCTEAGVFAYVFPARPYDIYLCPVFWNANIEGTDSRGGTIVHELSHFRVVAGTADHQYTQAGVQRLAVNSPELAVDNADSHEYFAENTPFIEMAEEGADGSTGDGPINGEPPSGGTDLLLAGQSIESSVALGGTVSVRVSGAVRVRVDTLRGDADLDVWSDAARISLLCESAYKPPVSDFCDVAGVDEVWVDVNGHLDSEFRLVAIADTSDVMASIPITGSLVDGDVVSGSLGQGELLAYAVNSGATLDLDSLSGDADLYVFSGYETTADRLVCESVNEAETSDGSTSDTCSATSTGAHAAVVNAFRGAEFSLRVTGGPATEPPGVPGDNSEDGASDDDPNNDGFAGTGLGSGGGCSIGNQGASGAGGAVPLAGLFLLIPFMRRRFGRLLRLPALLGVAVMSVACTPAVDPSGDSPGVRSGAGEGSSLGSAAGAGEVADQATLGDARLEIGAELEGNDRVALEAGSESGDAFPRVAIKVWVRNPGDSAVDFLLWNTPLESVLSADVFDVHAGDERVSYLGRVIKRGKPPASAWIRLEPGERYEAVVDLGSVYDFSATGSYRVMPAPTPDGDVARFNASAIIDVVTPAIQVEVET